jgi:oligogalacturonide lyase
MPVGLAAATRERRKSRQLPNAGEFTRFADPVTEIPVVRLTSVSSATRMPAPDKRFVSVKQRFLVISSDRTGSFCPFHLDLRTGVLQQLSETKRLDTQSLSLNESEQSVLLIDGGELKEIAIGNRRTHTLADGVSAFAVGRNSSELITVREGKLIGSSGQVLAVDVSRLGEMRPGSTGCLFERPSSDGQTELWYSGLAGTGKSCLLAQGRISSPFWSPDGQSVLFLREIQRDKLSVAEIHQVGIDDCREELVTPTSQFAVFAPNRNATVFVGASRSKAQPNVVLLLRSVKRELTLCEHHASDASAVTPVFSPDSRHVYFESDREGKPGLYSVNVELIVEPT